jgi:predicted RecB family nuclease
MRLTDDHTLRLSPSDLTTFTACRHAARLEVDRTLARPTPERGRDPDADMLAELGRRFERSYLEALAAEGLRVERVDGAPGDVRAETDVVRLMREGVDVIAQAPMSHRAWAGVADVLRKVEARSALGSWRYEVEDTKLARTTRTATVLQLLTYATLLEKLQGTPGEHVHVVTPSSEGRRFHRETLRVDDFAAVTRQVRARFEGFLDQAVAGEAVTVPEPVEHCMVCPWWAACRAHWRAQDHLSLVANLGGAHRTELERHRVSTRRALASRHGDLGFRPGYGRVEAYLAAAHQADVQVRSEVDGQVLVERLPQVDGEGLSRLPAPSPHDVYFDLEGTPFFGTGGLEYLWGWQVGDGEVTHHWATDHRSERAAFERFIDAITAHRNEHPDAHVYHFGPYEVAALKRLMGRHATREDELDALLRQEAFVDLYPVVRQGFRIGVEAYTLKDLERVHGYLREEDLRTLGPSKRAIEHAIVLGAPEEAPTGARGAVARYNADDVRSARALHAWCERERQAQGVAARATKTEGHPSEELQEQRDEARAVMDALRERLPEDRDAWDDEQRARALLADLIDFERRESKVAYWTLYQHQAMNSEELEGSPKALVGLQHLETIPRAGRQRTTTHRYRFPPQDVDRRSGETFHVLGPSGWVACSAELDLDRYVLTLKQGRDVEHVHVDQGFFWGIVRSDVIGEARLELARDVIARGLDADGRYRAARDLLQARVGRSAAGMGLPTEPGGDPVAAATRSALALQGGVLPIQGPPGAGKTYTAARLILGLVEAGKSVAVTAISHKAIGNVLAAVLAAARERGSDVRVGQKPGTDDDAPSGVTVYGDNGALRAALHSGSVQVAGGTAWVWSREEFREAVDTLVIDEAGQLSLAMALSVAAAARNVVLLGDPQQLAQPIQGTHPQGAEASALEHLLQGHVTLPPDRGLFLERTFRMAPPITRFVSETFYEGRLTSQPGTERVTLDSTDGFDGTGLTFVPVEHEGCDGLAPEEVTAVADVLGRLVRPGARVRDSSGAWSDLSLGGVMIAAPFNRHVDALREGLPAGPLIGTVDKLQGQERPVVIYALGVSTPDLAPRGLEFLFDLHRFNVAVSRAQARAIVVASPALLEAVPATVRGLRLLNAHVRFVEAARSASEGAP